MTYVVAIKFEYALFTDFRCHILIIIAYNHDHFLLTYSATFHRRQILLPG